MSDATQIELAEESVFVDYEQALDFARSCEPPHKTRSVTDAWGLLGARSLGLSYKGKPVAQIGNIDLPKSNAFSPSYITEIARGMSDRINRSEVLISGLNSGALRFLIEFANVELHAQPPIDQINR